MGTQQLMSPQPSHDFSPNPVETIDTMETLLPSQASGSNAQQLMSPQPSPQARCLDDTIDFSPKPVDTMETLLQLFLLLPAEQKFTVVNDMLCSVSATH